MRTSWPGVAREDGRRGSVSVSEQGKKAIRLLKRALEQAFALGLIPKNPAADVKAPRPNESPYVGAFVGNGGW